jgi:hypothetical protein
MAVCCQNLMLGVLSSHSTHCVLVGVLFKKFGLFLNTVVLTVTSGGFNYMCCAVICILLVLMYDTLMMITEVNEKCR